jgi:hypothetical protein
MDRNTHLTSLEVALYAESLTGMAKASPEVLADLILHMEECVPCRIEVMECCDAIPYINRILERESGFQLFLMDPAARQGVFCTVSGWLKKVIRRNITPFIRLLMSAFRRGRVALRFQ